MSRRDLCFESAVSLAGKIKTRAVSAHDVITAHLDQIERINPKVNAIVTLTAEAALREAQDADRALAQGRLLGPLHGLPVAHKDLFVTRGVRTTFGSPIYKDFIPDVDALPVERLKKAGAISLGKTNTPEFGAGSQTFNAVFGATKNPYNDAKTCGGSSGGSAVALACGMVALADGSDLAGSLRNPANFCNIVGHRPSVGRVPNWPDQVGWYPFTVAGPMARSVQDLALAMSVMSGPDDRSPISLDTPGEVFNRPLQRNFKNCKVAFSKTLGGLPVQKEVADVMNACRPVLERLGCELTDDEPDLHEAHEIFMLWRAWRTELRIAPLLEKHRALLKPTVIWNAEQGLPITGPELARAEAKRTELYHRMREFMNRYEFLVLPVNQVTPFDVNLEYPTEIEGVAMQTYIDWQRTCYYITTVGNPALSVPAGFTADGLPVGLQIVGRHRDDFGVLQLAHAFEEATGFGKKRPPIS